MQQPNYIQLADGTLIDTVTGTAVISTEINKAFSDVSSGSMLRPGAGLGDVNRRYIDDLPCTPAQSRAVFAILAARTFGLHELDVAKVFGISTKNVQDIESSEAYSKILEAILANIREHDQDVVRRKLNKAASKAADKVIELSDSVDDKIKLAASKDILDRVERDNAIPHSTNVAGLTIRILDDRESPAANVEVDIDA